MGKCAERLYNGIVKENPTFVQILGMCPTLAVTSSAINGVGMGLATTCILVLSNMVISMLRKVIPDKVRIPSYIVIIASFVTVIQFLMEAYVPSLNASLGIYIPLIVVNCIILGRAESYASKNKVLPSVFDGIGMGLGFTVGLTCIGIFRELIGKGCIFGYQILGEGNLLQNTSGVLKTIGNGLGAYTPITIFVLAPGAFFVLAFLVAFINKRNAVKAAKAGADVTICKPESCASCTNTMCGGRIFVAPVETSSEEVKEPEKPKIVIPDEIKRKPVEQVKDTQPSETQPGESKQEAVEQKTIEQAEEKKNVSESQTETVEERTELSEASETTTVEAETMAEETAEAETEKNADTEHDENNHADIKEEAATMAEETAEAEAETAIEGKAEVAETSETAEKAEVTETPETAEEAETEKTPETAEASETVKSTGDVEPKEEIEATESENPIPQAKVEEVIGLEETIPEEDESDITNTAKLVRPEIEDASQVDKYEEFIDVNANQGKRKRRNKRGKGGKR